MLEVFILLVACTIIAYMTSAMNRRALGEGGSLFEVSRSRAQILGNLCFAVLLIIMVFFSGTRTWMNDTATYISNFARKVPDALSGLGEVDWSIGANPAFQVYQIILRSLITKSGSGFIFVTASIVVSSYLIFLRKYSRDFGYSVYMFIAFLVYAFSMAAMKQTMAVAIAIWSIPLYLNNKKIRAALMIFLAVLVHPYVVLYFALFFATKNIWDRKTVCLIGLTLLMGAFYSTFVDSVLSIASAIGDEYDMELFMGEGISIFRLMVYAVPPILSFIYRDNIRKNGNGFTYLCINFSIISFCFCFLAGFGSPILFGRMANYFDIFQCLTLPIVFCDGMRKRTDRIIVMAISFLAFTYFYYTYYNKYAISWGTPFTGCFYRHISIFDLVFGW